MSSETQLVALARKATSTTEGAEAALNALLVLLYHPLRSFVQHRLSGMPDIDDLAHDAAQDALLRITREIHTCRATTDRQLLAWALTTVQRTTIDLLRSSDALAQRRRSSIDPAALPAPAPEESSVEGPGEGVLDESEMVLWELARSILGAVSPTARPVLWARGAEGATWAEVGEALSIPPTAAKRRFQRAQRHLRELAAQRLSADDAGTAQFTLREIRTILLGDVPGVV
jgi:RNA polymerase sigma factor (sigma-70 family)